jgi:polygalacturonase
MSERWSNRRELIKRGGIGFSAAAMLGRGSVSQSTHGAAASFGDGTFSVRSYGAVGDGKALDTVPFNKAIAAASAAGGGTVIVPPGTYLCFSIHLLSGVHVCLSEGSTVVAADSPLPGQTTGYNGGTYDAAESNITYEAFQDYGHNHWHNSLLWGDGLHDVTISGPGLIFGKGLSFGAERSPRGDYPVYTAEQAGVGNKAIALKNCRNVTLRDFSILKGGHFGLLLTGVDNLTIDNLKIDTDRDGMDIDCCKNVRVSNCTVNSPWDDGICPKSSFALGYNRSTENLTITNCLVTGSYELGSVLDGTFRKFPESSKIPRTGRIKCGTESNGGFRNIAISNCVFEGCQGLALETVDGALMEDIVISNITMRDIVTCPIFLRLGARLRGPHGSGDQSTNVGTLRRVLISNLNCYNSASSVCSTVSGIPGYAIEDLKFSNIFVQHHGSASAQSSTRVPPEFENKYPEPGMFGPMPAHGFYFRHLKNLEMSHVEVSPAAPDSRPAIYLHDVHRADFIAITAPNQNPAFFFNKSTDLRVMLSRAAKDTVITTADRRYV